MRKLTLSIMVGTIVFLFVGCANNPTPQPKVDLGIKKGDMKIYVDNTLDKDKQKRVRNAFVYTIRKLIKNNQFKVVKTKGYIGEGEWNPFGIRQDKEIKYHYGNFLGNTDKYIHVYEFDSFQYVNLYNFIFDKKHKLIGDFFGSADYYPINHNYTVKKIGDAKFEIKGFKNVEEALNIYLQIMRITKENQDFGKSYMKEKTKAGIDWTTNLYENNIVRYDPYELAVHKRLVLRPTILEASKKWQLESLLRQKHYTVVKDPKQANVIISVQNLAFGTFSGINSDSKVITNKIKNIRIINTHQVTNGFGWAVTNFFSMHTSGGNAMAGVSAALGVLSLFDTSEYNITSIDFVSIFVNGKNILNTVITPKLYSIKESKEKMEHGIGVYISIVNYTSAMEIEKLMSSTQEKVHKRRVYDEHEW